jgi:catechol 2,3-dioxygenase
VSLQVSDLQRSLDWYESVLGLRVQSRAGSIASLGPRGDPATLVELHERPGAQPSPSRGRLGLYHYAILLPTRGDLGRFVAHLGAIGTRAGASDHLVSEALYLRDPDNLGIEVYSDRPRAEWQRSDGELAMASLPLDFASLIDAGGGTTWVGMPSGTIMGHVHLHVGDVPTAESFFVDGLGLDVTARNYPGALFMSAGGYHHHLGANTWAGPGASPPGADDARLLEWSVVLPRESDVGDAAANLAARGAATSSGVDGVIVTDPWGTALRLTTAAGA